jgi:hypothetical protein
MSRDNKRTAYGDNSDSEDEELDYNSKYRTAPIKSQQRKENNMYSSDAKNESSSARAGSAKREANSYKMSKEEQEIENFGSNYHTSPVEAQQEQLQNTKRWLLRPCSRNEKATMKCYVERERSTLAMSPTIYRCFLEATSGSDGAPPTSSSATVGDNNKGPVTGRFMMSARKFVGKSTSYYLISLDNNPSDDRGSESVIGKIRGNAVGSKYIITDGGLAPEKTVAPSMLRKELGLITFQFDSGKGLHLSGYHALPLFPLFPLFPRSRWSFSN